MNTAAYLINLIFILMVIRQVREQPLDARCLATPVLAVGCAVVMFLHAAPARRRRQRARSGVPGGQ